MISDILIEADKEYNYMSLIDNKDFVMLDDHILTGIKYNKNLGSNCKKILEDIDKRNFYKIIETYNNYYSLKEAEDIFFDKNPDLKKEDVHLKRGGIYQKLNSDVLMCHDFEQACNLGACEMFNLHCK